MVKLAFVHIPKTGGSALVKEIIDFWPRELVSPHTGMQDFLRDPIAKSYHFTAGHVFYPKIKELLASDMQYITLLREPVQRACSHWIHISRFVLTDVKTIEEYLYDSPESQFAKNLMARHLCWWPKGGLNPIPPNTGLIEQMPMDMSEDELYTQARNNLLQFWHVGTQDKWVETVQKIYTMFNKPLPSHVKQRGAQDYRLLLSKQLLKDLNEFNRVDTELYREFGGK